ncbi:MAG: type II secretion system protein [Candidatus Babeliales bacterium]|jgi:type II secretory pathway pseudopilin PulG
MSTGYNISKNHTAFTLLETLVVIALMIVIAAFTLPRLFRRAPAVEWKNIADDLNNLVLFARHNAIEERRTLRIVFRQIANNRDTITVEEPIDDPDRPGRVKYRPVSSYYMTTIYRLADGVKLKAVYHGKREMLADNRGVAYGAVTPDGLVQDIVVHMTRVLNGTESGGTFKMNPFLGTFEFYDGLLRPGHST